MTDTVRAAYRRCIRFGTRKVYSVEGEYTFPVGFFPTRRAGVHWVGLPSRH